MCSHNSVPSVLPLPCYSSFVVLCWVACRYKDDAHKAKQFPLDCQELAVAQCIYANQLKAIGVVDEIIWESSAGADEGKGETFEAFPSLRARIQHFLAGILQRLLALSAEELIAQRYRKYRAMGSFSELDVEQRQEVVQRALEASGPALAEAAAKKKAAAASAAGEKASVLIAHLAEVTVNGAFSRYRGLAPSSCPLTAPTAPTCTAPSSPPRNAKSVLDSEGPEALAKWARQQTRVLLTDTTMRDAHQVYIIRAHCPQQSHPTLFS